MLFLILAGWIFSGLTSCQETATSESSGDVLKIDYEKYTLQNGLDVILHKDDSDPIVSVAIMFHVGSNREKPGRTGFAHFFEHMLFQNSENVGKGNFFKIIEELGGDFNGGTWNDGTVYYEVVPKDALEKILWMESDRMGYMINTVTVPVFENEKEIVKNEKRQRVDNQPYGHTSYVIGKALYPADHPYNWQVIGSLEDLQAATIDDVKEFYDKWYGPNNATMVIAGDIDFAETKEMVQKYFEEIPAKEEEEAIKAQPAQLANTVKLMHEDKFAQLPELRLVWPTIEDGHPDIHPLNYLGQLLSDGKRAPLYKEIVENQKLAPSVSAYNGEREIAGEFYVRVRTNDGVDLDQVSDAVFKAFSDFETNGIDDRDMERIKNAQETQFYSGISSLLSKSFQLAQMNEFRGSPDALEEEIKKILAVTKEDIMRVYEKYIKGKPYLATSFVPLGKPDLALEGSATAEVVEEPIVQGAEAPPLAEDQVDFEKTPSKIDRSIAPPLGTAPTVNMPKIWQSELANGLEVFGIENKELPLVEFSLRIKGGLLLDDPNKIGVANLMTDIMQEGTKNKTPEELEDAIGQLGANISMSTSTEYITLRGSCLSRNFEKVMVIFQEMLLEPRWDEKEFDRIKQSTITQIQQRSAQPDNVATKVFNKLIYGENNIMSNSTQGTIESVNAITLDDLKTFYDKYYSPSISSFHIAGAITESKVKKALHPLEEKWSAKEVIMPELPEPVAISTSKIYFIDVPDAKQSVVRIGAPAMSGNAEDYYAATVVNQRLGNGTSARLFQQLREEKGYTYGAGSAFARRINDGYFIGYSSVRSNVTKESVELFKEIFEKYKEDYSKEDLEVTKNMMLKGNALALETLYDKMGILENISTYELPLDYIKKDETVMMGMDLDKAKSLIGKYINADKMVYLVVGDAKTQADRLKEIGMGDPIMLDKEGVPVEQVAN
ncbi:MAG: peptidase M16 [Saprospiraceae bacterium]|nr:MAG: peptidase M16 [Saprospiraceae bacterium]